MFFYESFIGGKLSQMPANPGIVQESWWNGLGIISPKI